MHIALDMLLWFYSTTVRRMIISIRRKMRECLQFLLSGIQSCGFNGRPPGDGNFVTSPLDVAITTIEMDFVCNQPMLLKCCSLRILPLRKSVACQAWWWDSARGLYPFVRFDKCSKPGKGA